MTTYIKDGAMAYDRQGNFVGYPTQRQMGYAAPTMKPGATDGINKPIVIVDPKEPRKSK